MLPFDPNWVRLGHIGLGLLGLAVWDGPHTETETEVEEFQTKPNLRPANPIQYIYCMCIIHGPELVGDFGGIEERQY